MPFSAEDIRWMRSALSLSKRGLGQVWPNPAVGCIIVRNGIVVGRGITAAGGRPHAEAQALQQAGSAADGATAYVTLEPCCHPGRDHSCSDRLIAAGVARVVAAITDPNPQVNGQGFAKLRQAGIAVDTGLLEIQAREIHAGFFSRIQKGRPLVTLKLATSIDGKIASQSGESRWITGPEARRRVHLLRSSHDAVLIGSGTAISDNPMLDVRGLGIRANPVRIVLDTSLPLDPASRLLQSARTQPLWIICGPDADQDIAKAVTGAGAELLQCPLAADGHLDLAQALRILADKGLTRIFCEGGATLASALIKNRLADVLIVFGSGKIIGSDGLDAIGPLRLAKLESAPRFRRQHQLVIGEDLMSVWTPGEDSD